MRTSVVTKVVVVAVEGDKRAPNKFGMGEPCLAEGTCPWYRETMVAEPCVFGECPAEALPLTVFMASR